MTKLLLIALVKLCSNSDYTPIQTRECSNFYGNCVADYKTESEAYQKCNEKWEKVKEEIK